MRLKPWAWGERTAYREACAHALARHSGLCRGVFSSRAVATETSATVSLSKGVPIENNKAAQHAVSGTEPHSRCCGYHDLGRLRSEKAITRVRPQTSLQGPL